MIEFDFNNNDTDVNHIIYHSDDSLIIFNGAVRNCDVIIFVRKDYTDDLNDKWQTCDIAPHLFTISQHHQPPEHGGRVHQRADLGTYTEVVLYGVHDSDDYLALDPLLEDTGTYSLCHAKFPDHMPASMCETWTPNTGNYTWYENIQLHVKHKPPSMPPPSKPPPSPPPSPPPPSPPPSPPPPSCTCTREAGAMPCLSIASDWVSTSSSVRIACAGRVRTFESLSSGQRPLRGLRTNIYGARRPDLSPSARKGYESGGGAR